MSTVSEPLPRYSLEPFATDALVPDAEGEWVRYADATRAAQERGLDVAALARAIQWDETPIGAYVPPIQPFWDRAERIAREYAAALIEKRSGAES